MSMKISSSRTLWHHCSPHSNQVKNTYAIDFKTFHCAVHQYKHIVFIIHCTSDTWYYKYRWILKVDNRRFMDFYAGQSKYIPADPSSRRMMMLVQYVISTLNQHHSSAAFVSSVTSTPYMLSEWYTISEDITFGISCFSCQKYSSL